MATNDLMTELQKDNINLDDDSERKVFFSGVYIMHFDLPPFDFFHSANKVAGGVTF